MKVLQNLRRHSVNLWRFIAMVTMGFYKNDGLYRASALSFTTLLALVPLMSVSLTAISAFPYFNKIHKPIQDFIFDNFVPETGKVVQQYLLEFAQKASELSVTGLIFLVISAVLLLFTIEQAMNQIWHVRVARRSIPAFLMYWAVLTLAPLLIGLSVVLTTYFMSIPIISKSIIHEVLHQTWVLACLPFILALASFTLLYVAIPNCKVKIRHGFIGAVVAAIAFEIAKWGFTLYIQQFDTYELLYGAFSTIPLFFIWVYTMWTIILIGAEVAHGLSVPRHPPRESGGTSS